MSASTQTTWEEFLNLPDAPGKQELLDGELIVLPPAKLVHMQITMDLFLMLVAALSKSRVRIETGYQLRSGWLQPDVSVIWPDQPVENGWTQGAPMVAVEIVSPASTAAEIDRKISTYLEEGGAEVWVIYPATHRMNVFRKETWESVTESYHCALQNLVVDLKALLSRIAA